MLDETENSPPGSPVIGSKSIPPVRTELFRQIVDNIVSEYDKDEDNAPPSKRRRLSDHEDDDEHDSRYEAVTNRKGSGKTATSPITIEDRTADNELLTISSDDESETRSVVEVEADSNSIKGATRPPRFAKLMLVDGVITIVENPFSDGDDDDEVDDTYARDDFVDLNEPANRLVKPASKKRLVEIEEQRKEKGSDTVNDDLVDVRGEGRYFGRLENQHVVVCINCHEPGHMASECKAIVCTNCGEMGDHIARNCPKTKRCSNCNKLGHASFSCVEQRKDIYCSSCRSTRHGYETCPSIWSVYSYTHQSLKPISTMFCYNCSQEGHYGDDCHKQRPFMQPFINQSAFTKHNLPANYKLSSHLESVTRGFTQKSFSTGASLSNGSALQRDNYRPGGRKWPRFSEDGYRDRDRDSRDRGQASSSRPWDSRRGQGSDKHGYKPARQLDYSDADRDDWFARRKKESDSRYDYARGPAKGSSKGGKFKEKLNAGKAALKKFVR
ncbi:hypothetical protein V1514DRAFT_342151 [Lipomyces japonicus]|uniref:uncharacterized protein n=1 Tax=Lipomyces japonicus TaxID=56871 RepID=UPI0034CFC764